MSETNDTQTAFTEKDMSFVRNLIGHPEIVSADEIFVNIPEDDCVLHVKRTDKGFESWIQDDSIPGDPPHAMDDDMQMSVIYAFRQSIKAIRRAREELEA